MLIRNYILVLICLFSLVLSGCAESGPLCNSPYIEYKTGECCLDKDGNSICDVDEEITEEIEVQQDESKETEKAQPSRPSIECGDYVTINFVGCILDGDYIRASFMNSGETDLIGMYIGEELDSTRLNSGERKEFVVTKQEKIEFVPVITLGKCIDKKMVVGSIMSCREENPNREEEQYINCGNNIKLTYVPFSCKLTATGVDISMKNEGSSDLQGISSFLYDSSNNKLTENWDMKPVDVGETETYTINLNKDATKIEIAPLSGEKACVNKKLLVPVSSCK